MKECRYKGQCEMFRTYALGASALTANYRASVCDGEDFDSSIKCPNYRLIERVLELEGIVSRTKTQE